MSAWTFYVISLAVLAGLLFFPVAKLVWVLAVRRLERRLGHPLTERERRGQLNRARFIAIIVSVLFSALFNYQVLDMASRG